MRSLTVSYCTFLHSTSCLCVSLYKANEHSTYRHEPPCSSKHTRMLSHTVMYSETYPCCYGCQQYLKKDRSRSLSLSRSLCLRLAHTREGVVERVESEPFGPVCCRLATQWGQVAIRWPKQKLLHLIEQIPQPGAQESIYLNSLSLTRYYYKICYTL